MPGRGYVPRLSIELDQDDFDFLKENIPWGAKNAMFVKLSKEVRKLMENMGESGWAVAAMIIDGKIGLCLKDIKGPAHGND